MSTNIMMLTAQHTASVSRTLGKLSMSEQGELAPTAPSLNILQDVLALIQGVCQPDTRKNSLLATLHFLRI